MSPMWSMRFALWVNITRFIFCGAPICVTGTMKWCWSLQLRREVRYSRDWPTPVPARDRRTPMSTLSLTLPQSLQEQVEALAQKEGISVNEFIALAVAEKLATQ